MGDVFYAHSKEGAPPDQWQPLQDHLSNTAKLAAEMAGQFGCSEWGYLAGLWHDLGKFSEAFRQRLAAAASGCNPGSTVDHATAGGILAEKRFGPAGRILSYLIAGHHTGLPDWQTEASGSASLAQRLQNKTLLERVPTEVRNSLGRAAMPAQRPAPGSDPAFWIRMLYSCLVDADFLDTEAFMELEKSSCRGGYSTLPELLPRFTEYMNAKARTAEDTPVNRRRNEILRRCIDFAGHKAGIFTLTVPTGGGKTLSSMAFTLHHAGKYAKRRIIYVIPYTSIIEQTADQFRQIFGDNVIEHHSNIALDEKDETEDLKRQLATENWDAPIIVTTSVQFFESLFASRSSRCRKLHNIVNSVVILDEAQLLPPEFLNPILFALRELQRNYGVSLLLCTATQPALTPHQAPDFNFAGLPGAVEIMEDPVALHRDFQRTAVTVPADLNQPRDWKDLAPELSGYPSVLCIVNRRDDCRELHGLMPQGTIHLSALMCGAHRARVIGEIKDRLKNRQPTRVISTQLVEAGVDFDFPVVYRALAGLDSVAQAAGRCNREGHLARGKVVVFVPPTQAPPGHLRQAAEIGRQILAEERDDPLALKQFDRFFRDLYWLKGNEGLDAKDIMRDLLPDSQLRFSFRSAARKFHLIDESLQVPVIVCYGESPELMALLEKLGPDRWLIRRLQRYVVNIPRYEHEKLLAKSAIAEIYPGIFVQLNPDAYDPVLGFDAGAEFKFKSDLII